MTNHIHYSDDARGDSAREDRVVEHLRSHGVFGATPVAVHRRAPAGRHRLRRGVIAAAAVLVLGVLGVVADRKLRPHVPSAPPDEPTLLIWY
jgi:hypothetical protein